MLSTTRLVRSTGSWCALGALLVTLTSLATVVDADLGRPGTAAFRYGGAVLVVGHLLVVAGVLGLARGYDAGTGWLAWTGLAAAAVGGLLIAAAEFVMRFSVGAGETLFGIGIPLTGFGMLVTGTWVLRAGRWRGWYRFVPLACGAYPFLVLYPTEALAGGISYPAIAGWNVCWLLLGVALLRETDPAPAALPA